MSAGAQEFLLAPISSEAPCGRDLEDSHLLASFDAYRLFGQVTALPAETNWPEIRDKARGALSESKDIRLLAFYAAAIARTAGLIEFSAVLGAASKWLAEHWDAVYPRVDEDAILRKNALSCLADRMAIVDGVRRAPLVSSRVHGVVTPRDIDIATGQLAPTDSDTKPPTQAQINAALEDTPLEEVQRIERAVIESLDALTQCTEIMRSRAGYEAAPEFEPLTAQLGRLAKFLREHLSPREPAEAPAAADDAVDAAGERPRAALPGAIRDRADAIAALEAAAKYFRQFEPSSPIPMLIERATRLGSMSFIEVLQDIAPEGVKQAKLIGGIRDT